MECKDEFAREGNAPSWKGDSASYSAFHKWMVAKYGRPKTCEMCNQEFEKTRVMHWAIIHGKGLTRERKNWLRVCVWCHLKYDKTDIKSNGGRWGKGNKAKQLKQ